MAEVSELKGYRSLRALNAFHTLMLGIKMLPMYQSETYEDFYTRVEGMDESEQIKIVKQSVLFTELSKDEVEAVISFCKDKNGVSYGTSNIKNLGPGELHDIIVSVCMEILKIKIDFVNAAEKKN